jgi:aryl-alcohol dehydrogenase
VIGSAAVGTEASLDVVSILIAGRTVRGIVEGDSVPRSLLPRLIALWEQGKFPVERMMTSYDFDQIDEAAHDAEGGKVIKPVLRIA